MGKRGPKPTPTKTLKARGSWRGEINKSEPEPEFQIPSAPKWLNSTAKAEWLRIVPELARNGMLSLLDRTTLALYCQAYADYVNSLDLMKKPFPTTALVLTKNNNAVQHPALSIKNKAFQTLLNVAREFGLSPSSRSNIQVQKTQTKKAGRKAAPFKVA